jgi:hypothetical protein
MGLIGPESIVLSRPISPPSGEFIDKHVCLTISILHAVKLKCGRPSTLVTNVSGVFTPRGVEAEVG